MLAGMFTSGMETSHLNRINRQSWSWRGRYVFELSNCMLRSCYEKDIKEVQLTESKIYALSRSGKVYVLPSAPSEQKSKPSSASSSWGATWFSRDDKSVDFVEVMPREKLGWGERYVLYVNFHDLPLLTSGRIKSIVAGDDHLLAVTSKGRAFAHPVNLHANDHGQLGMRKLEVQSDSKDGTLAVDLVHKPAVYPFIKASLDHGPRPSDMSDEVSQLDDKSIHFFPYLFEIPVLRGVLVEQVAAGSKSSFARTNSGRVLAWGANRHGCVAISQLVRLFGT